MPNKPARSCRFSGCPKTISGGGGYCDDHREYEKAIINEYSKRRGPSTPDSFYQSRSWIKYRDWYRKQHPLCEDCLKAGRGPIPMKIVDHIIEIKDGGERFDEENTRSLCQECHNRKTALKRKERANVKT